MAKKNTTAATRSRGKKRVPRKATESVADTASEPSSNSRPLLDEEPDDVADDVAAEQTSEASEATPPANSPHGSPILIEHDGVSAGQVTVVINGEPWLPMHVHQQALAELCEKKSKVVTASQKHRRCPVCYDNLGGIGNRKSQNQISGRMHRVFYSCDQCGSEWGVDVDVYEHDGVTYKRSKVSKVRTFEDGAA